MGRGTGRCDDRVLSYFVVTQNPRKEYRKAGLLKFPTYHVVLAVKDEGAATLAANAVFDP